MNLNVNDERSIANPSSEAVRQAIMDLLRDEFAILSQADEEYVQTYYHDDGTYQLEFRAGSADEHYAVDREDLTGVDVAGVFARYRAGEDDWKSGWNWLKVDLDDDD